MIQDIDHNIVVNIGCWIGSGNEASRRYTELALSHRIAVFPWLALTASLVSPL
jgi:hypothetical protein